VTVRSPTSKMAAWIMGFMILILRFLTLTSSPLWNKIAGDRFR
jgi:hypothetical protein